MLQSPLISVVVLSYNYGRFLARAIESVLNQSFSDYEIIVIDNGSTDDTFEVAGKFGDKVRIYRFEQNVGRAKSRNKGIELSQGKYVQFLDADDRLLPDKLKKAVGVFNENETAVVVYSQSLFVDENDRPMPEASSWYRDRHFQPSDGVLKRFAQENFMLTHDGLVRREAVLQIGGFDDQSDMLEDWDFWFRLAINFESGFYRLPEDLALYFFHSGSITKNRHYHYKIRKNFVYKHLENAELENQLGSELYRLFVTYQHQVLASDAYTLKNWKESRSEIINSIKGGNYQIKADLVKLFAKSFVREFFVKKR